MTAAGAPVVTAVEHAIRDVLGKNAAHVTSPGTYNQKHIDRSGRLHKYIAHSLGGLDLAHQPDEWIGVQDMGLALCQLLLRKP